MSVLGNQLENLALKHPKFLNKGGFCVGLVVTKTAQDRGLPIKPQSLRTEEGGQVAGLALKLRKFREIQGAQILWERCFNIWSAQNSISLLGQISPIITVLGGRSLHGSAG